MEPIAIIIGIGIISFMFIYFAFKLEDNHIILKILTIFVGIAMLFIIPRALIDYPSNCSIVVTEQNITSTVAGAVTTSTSSLGYGTYCDTPKDSATILLQGQMIYYIILLIYAFIYLGSFYLTKYFRRHR